MSQFADTALTTRHPKPVGSTRWGGIVPGSTDPASYKQNPEPGKVISHADIQCSSCSKQHDLEIILDYTEAHDRRQRHEAMCAISGVTVSCKECCSRLAIPFADPEEGRHLAAFDPRDSTKFVNSLMQEKAGTSGKVTEAEKRYSSPWRSS